jgi:hypothetical protein
VNTVFDWITVAIFCGLVVLFLQRTMEPLPFRDRMIHYLPPVAGCAGANYLGNAGAALPAILLIAATIGYLAMVLKPFTAAR